MKLPVFVRRLGVSFRRHLNIAVWPFGLAVDVSYRPFEAEYLVPVAPRQIVNRVNYAVFCQLQGVDLSWVTTIDRSPQGEKPVHVEKRIGQSECQQVNGEDGFSFFHGMKQEESEEEGKHDPG